MASQHGDLAHLLPLNYKRQISAWLEEDCPSFDYGGFVVGESPGTAKLLGKSQVNPPIRRRDVDGAAGANYSFPLQGVVAGVPFFNEVFSQLGCT